MEAVVCKRALALMKSRRASGASYHVIAAELNTRGLAAPRGGRWYGNSVRQALINLAPQTRPREEPRKHAASPDQALFDAWNANFI